MFINLIFYHDPQHGDLSAELIKFQYLKQRKIGKSDLLLFVKRIWH